MPSAESAGRRNARILVADDNVEAVLAVATLLEIEGHEVRQAHDGLEAFEIAKAFKPEIAILDLSMPRRDGLELARLIKAQPWGASIVLIALTGHNDSVTRSKATANGFDLFLSKPIDPATFESLIQRVLPGIAPSLSRPA